MAQIIKLRRSAVAGKVPTNAQLQLGELSVNTTDGKFYFTKSGSIGGPTVEELISTNTVNTGSVAISGSLTVSGSFGLNDNATNFNIEGNGSGETYLNSVDGNLVLYPHTGDVLVKTGNLRVDGFISGSEFKGDGSGLYNLPNVTGSQVNYFAYFDTTSSVKDTFIMNVTNSGSTIGMGTNAFTSYEPERLIVDNGSSYNIATFQTSVYDNFAEVNIKNFGGGPNASTDLVLWNDVTTEGNGFLDLGINSSTYNAGNVGYAGDAYLFSALNDLYIGSVSNGTSGHLHLFAGNQWTGSSISLYQDGTVGFHTDELNNQADTITTSGFTYEFNGNTIFDNNVSVVGAFQVPTYSGNPIGEYTGSIYYNTTDLSLIHI